MAVREVTHLVEGTPTGERELVQELREAASELKVQHRLRGWTDAVKTLPRKNIVGFKWLLLVLDTSTNTVKVVGYASRQEASQAIAEIEKSGNEEMDAVLVWVQSVSDLRSAYPNYYADTREFIRALETVLRVSGRKR